MRYLDATFEYQPSPALRQVAPEHGLNNEDALEAPVSDDATFAGLAPLSDGQIAVDGEIARNLWQVRVETGATVEAGDVLLVIESMKMEISVIAPCAGTVGEIHVAPGSPVRAGQRVVVMAGAASIFALATDPVHTLFPPQESTARREDRVPGDSMRFDLQSLKLFVAVCEHGSIARAAEAENIAPSALSKRMSHLEDTLKTALFVRSNKGLELTVAAAALLQHARVLLRDIKQMESELLDHAEGVRGQIRLHASLSTIVQYIANDIRDFLDLHPGLRIDLQESLSPAVVRAVAENTADIGVFGGTTVTTGLQVYPYRSDRLVVIMPPDHPLSQADKVKFREVAEYPLVGPQVGSYLNSLVLRAAADLDHPLKLSIRVNGFEPVRSMVEARLGVGLVPEHHAQRYVSSAPLVAVQLDEPWAERHWKICVREAESLPAPVQLFLKHLLARQEQQAPGRHE